MQPNVGDDGRRSTGPKEPMPTACNCPPECSFRKVTAEPIVASGDVVGSCVTARSSGPVPTAQTNLVPPASIAPNTYRSFASLKVRFEFGSEQNTSSRK